MEVYQSQAVEVKGQLSKLKEDRSNVFESQITEMQEEVKKLKRLLEEIKEPLEAFDEKLFQEVVTDISISNQDEMTLTVLGGLRFTERL